MKLRLHQRYFLAILGLVATAIIAVSSALMVHYEPSIAAMKDTISQTYTAGLEDQFESRARGLAIVTSHALANPLALLDVEGVQEIILAVEAEPDVISASVSDHTGLALFDHSAYVLPPSRDGSGHAPLDAGAATSDRLRLKKSQDRLVVSAPIHLHRRMLGVVNIELSMTALNRDIDTLSAELTAIDRSAKRSRTLWVVAVIGALVGVYALSTGLVANNLSRPIELLGIATRRIGQGERASEMPIHRTDELGDLARSLQAMALDLRRTTVSRDSFERILESMRDGLVVTTPAGNITSVNEAATRLLAREAKQLVGSPIADFLRSDMPILTLQYHGAPENSPPNSYEATLITGDQKNVPVLLSIAGVRGPGDTLEGVVYVMHDIAERKQLEAHIQHMAYHDTLTGLPNRVLLAERLGRAIAQAKRDAQSVAVLLLDLDHFKDINDTLGHNAGDKVLTIVAGRISGALRETDTVARLGGDEFAIVQARAHQPHDAGALCGRLVRVLSDPIREGTRDLHIGVSIGIAMYPEHGEDLEQLLHNADLALYQAKSEGRSAWRFFERRLGAQLVERRTLEEDLRRAFECGGLTLCYQPQVALPTYQLVGVEALLRWHHPERGWVPPETFIPLAEETGLILPLGEWVLRTACIQATAWAGEGGPQLKVAINLSPMQFLRGDLPALVQGTLVQSNIVPQRVVLEINESILIRDTAANLETLLRLKELGVSVAMDDFGTGYSSLGFLRRFPFSGIKIDCSFVQDLGRSDEAIAILRAAIVLSHSLGMVCIAEGVETRSQLEQLKQEGCPEAQGYYFSVPLSAQGISALLQEGRKLG